MWFLLALGAAVGAAAADVLVKRRAGEFPVHALAAGRWLYALPLLILLLPFLRWPSLSASSWLLLAVIGPLEVAALFLYTRAVARTPLSLCLPFLAFTPPLLIVTGYLVLGERVPPLGVLGVCLVGAGAYAMHIGDVRRGGLLAPVRALWREAGPRWMLVVAVIYGLNAAVGKKILLETGPVFFGVLYLALLTAGLLPALALSGRPLGPVFRGWRRLAPIGLIVGLAALAQFGAYALAPVAYAIAVKRTSLLFGVLAGRIIFGEDRFAERIGGAALMLAGIAAITFSG